MKEQVKAADVEMDFDQDTTSRAISKTMDDAKPKPTQRKLPYAFLRRIVINQAQSAADDGRKRVDTEDP